ncbi:MAG: MFS transporter [Xanthobacteraceae bacterium]|nr:MFS transporter [Xanthobacteraceae bacterium]
MDATTPAAASKPPLAHREAQQIVWGILLPVFMGSVDSTILASALPTIGRDLGDVHLLPWLITAYLIASTAVTPLYGKISDIHGRRRTVMAALTIHMVGSLICALSPNLLVLIFGRVVHGLGGGGLTSMGMAVLGDLAAPKDRGRYYSYFSATYTTAGACGPALGGFISDYVHWSAIFWLNVPVGMIALRLTSERLRRLPRHERPHRLDVAGAALIVAASVAFMLGLTLGGSRYPWISPQVLGLAGAALALGTLFVLRLLTAPEPLIPVSILSDKVARCALAANTFGWAPIVGLNVFMPTYLQSVLGMSATAAGLSLMAIMVALNTSAGLTGQVIGRVVHYKRLPVVGLMIAIATLVFMGWNAHSLTPWSVAALLALLGVGFGPVPPVAMVSLQNTVEVHHLGTAVGTLSFLRNLCATIIVAIFGALVLMGSARVLPRGVDGLALPAERFTHVFYVAAASLVVSLMALLLMDEKPLRSSGPAEDRDPRG